MRSPENAESRSQKDALISTVEKVDAVPIALGGMFLIVEGIANRNLADFEGGIFCLAVAVGLIKLSARSLSNHPNST